MYGIVESSDYNQANSPRLFWFKRWPASVMSYGVWTKWTQRPVLCDTYISQQKPLRERVLEAKGWDTSGFIWCVGVPKATLAQWSILELTTSILLATPTPGEGTVHPAWSVLQSRVCFVNSEAGFSLENLLSCNWPPKILQKECASCVCAWKNCTKAASPLLSNDENALNAWVWGHHCGI